MKKIWVLVAKRNGEKQYLQPGNFWSRYKDGAREFGSKAAALEEKRFMNYAAQPVQIEVPVNS